MMAEGPSESTATAIVRGGVWALVGRVSGAVFALMSAMLVARLLEPVDAGAYFSITTTVLIAAILASLGIPQTVARVIGIAAIEHPAATRRATWRGLQLVLAGTLFVGLGMVVVGLVSGSPSALAPRSSALTLLLAGGLLVLTTVRTGLVESLRALFDIRAASLWSEIVPRVGLFMVLLGLWSIGLGIGLDGALAATAGVWTVSAAGAALTLRRRLRPFPGRDPAPAVGEYLRLGFPWLASSGVWVAVSQIGLVIVSVLGTGSDAALYGVAMRTADRGCNSLVDCQRDDSSVCREDVGHRLQ